MEHRIRILCHVHLPLVVVLLQIGFSQQHIGESCTLRRTQESGQCKLLSDCPQALETLRSKGISPETCGFDGVKPVVCCVDHTVGSKSKQKCKEYSQHAKKHVGPFSPHLSTEDCDVLYTRFIIPGNRAGPAEFPHMAVIGYDGENEDEKEWLCAGALISDRFVLTASICLDNHTHGEPKYIRIGDAILDNELDFSMPQDFNVKAIFKHPNYTSEYNSIGLLELDKPANFTMFARPVCLDTNATVVAEQVIASGWGRETFSPYYVSSHMLKEILDILPPEECTKKYKSTPFHGKTGAILDEKQFCVGSRGTQNTCMFGPAILQVYNNEVHCTYSIVGVTSFGRGCGIGIGYDVFTPVLNYIEWIEGIVWS